jgi:uncharacterized protein (TIGR02466 family)
MQINSIFPTGIGIVKNDSVIIDKEQLLSSLTWKEDQSKQGFFDQSQTNLHELDEWKPLTDWIKQQARLYWNQLGWQCDDLWFTQCWINNMSSGGNISSHWHSNSMISGVYYFLGDHNTGGTIFESTKNPLEFSFQTEILKDTIYTAGRHLVPAVEDSLVLFPSYISHFSEPNRFNAPRYTLAFNLLPTTLGKENHFNLVRFK